MSESIPRDPLVPWTFVVLCLIFGVLLGMSISLGRIAAALEALPER